VWQGKAVEAGQGGVRQGMAGRGGQGRAGQGEAWRSWYGYSTTVKEKKMSKFSKHTRERVITDYLQRTGKNMYVPEEFVIWLQGQPNHEAYEAFHGRDDELLWQAKLDLARDFVSGLRINVTEEVVDSGVTTIKVTEYPSYISPVSNRKNGGGYETFDPNSEESQAELRRQAGVQLAAWLNRFRGSAENIGLNMKPLEDMVRILRDEDEEAA
jgi:hypothetical protein